MRNSKPPTAPSAPNRRASPNRNTFIPNSMYGRSLRYTSPARAPAIPSNSRRSASGGPRTGRLASPSPPPGPSRRSPAAQPNVPVPVVNPIRNPRANRNNNVSNVPRPAAPSPGRNQAPLQAPRPRNPVHMAGGSDNAAATAVALPRQPSPLFQFNTQNVVPREIPAQLFQAVTQLSNTNVNVAGICQDCDDTRLEVERLQIIEMETTYLNLIEEAGFYQALILEDRAQLRQEDRFLSEYFDNLKAQMVTIVQKLKSLYYKKMSIAQVKNANWYKASKTVEDSDKTKNFVARELYNYWRLGLRLRPVVPLLDIEPYSFAPYRECPQVLTCVEPVEPTVRSGAGILGTSARVVEEVDRGLAAARVPYRSISIGADMPRTYSSLIGIAQFRSDGRLYESRPTEEIYARMLLELPFQKRGVNIWKRGVFWVMDPNPVSSTDQLSVAAGYSDYESPDTEADATIRGDPSTSAIAHFYSQPALLPSMSPHFTPVVPFLDIRKTAEEPPVEQLYFTSDDEDGEQSPDCELYLSPRTGQSQTQTITSDTEMTDLTDGDSYPHMDSQDVCNSVQNIMSGRDSSGFETVSEADDDMNLNTFDRTRIEQRQLTQYKHREFRRSRIQRNSARNASPSQSTGSQPNILIDEPDMASYMREVNRRCMHVRNVLARSFSASYLNDIELIANVGSTIVPSNSIRDRDREDVPTCSRTITRAPAPASTASSTDCDPPKPDPPYMKPCAQRLAKNVSELKGSKVTKPMAVKDMPDSLRFGKFGKDKTKKPGPPKPKPPPTYAYICKDGSTLITDKPLSLDFSLYCPSNANLDNSESGPPGPNDNNKPGPSNLGPKAGVSNPGPKAGPKAGVSNPGPKAGPSNAGPKAGGSNPGPKAGPSNAGPMAGLSYSGTKPGQSNAGPKPGPSNAGKKPGPKPIPKPGSSSRGTGKPKRGKPT